MPNSEPAGTHPKSDDDPHVRVSPKTYWNNRKVRVPKVVSAFKCEEITVKWQEFRDEEGYDTNWNFIFKEVQYWMRSWTYYYEATYNTCDPSNVYNIHESQPPQPGPKYYGSHWFGWQWEDPGTMSSPKYTNMEMKIGVTIYTDNNDGEKTKLKKEPPKTEEDGKIVYDDDSGKDAATNAVIADYNNRDHYETHTELGTISGPSGTRELDNVSANEFSFLASGAIAADRGGMYLKTAGHRTFYLPASLKISSETLNGLGVFDGRAVSKDGKPVKYIPNEQYIITYMDMSEHSAGTGWYNHGSGNKVWVNYKDIRLTLTKAGFDELKLLH